MNKDLNSEGFRVAKRKLSQSQVEELLTILQEYPHFAKDVLVKMPGGRMVSFEDHFRETRKNIFIDQIKLSRSIHNPKMFGLEFGENNGIMIDPEYINMDKLNDFLLSIQ